MNELRTTIRASELTTVLHEVLDVVLIVDVRLPRGGHACDPK